MYALNIGDLVRLKQPVHRHRLTRGELGVIQNSFVGSTVAYEVEFHPRGLTGTVSALVFREQLEGLGVADECLY
jgi:hypothetical protein